MFYEITPKNKDFCQARWDNIRHSRTRKPTKTSEPKKTQIKYTQREREWDTIEGDPSDSLTVVHGFILSRGAGVDEILCRFRLRRRQLEVRSRFGLSLESGLRRIGLV
jgi:hypothetical protein